MLCQLVEDAGGLGVKSSRIFDSKGEDLTPIPVAFAEGREPGRTARLDGPPPHLCDVGGGQVGHHDVVEMGFVIRLGDDV